MNTLAPTSLPIAPVGSPSASATANASHASRVAVTTAAVTDSAPTVRACVNCHATQTPLWRRSPLGPKTLCNACGVRMKKGRLAYADGKFHAVESPAALAKRRKAEAAARAAATISANRAAGRSAGRTVSSARVRKTTVRRPRNKNSTQTQVQPHSHSQAQNQVATGLYFLLAAIEFVEAS